MERTLIPYVYADAKHEKMIDIYSKLLDSRKIFLVGEVNKDSASLVVTQLLYLDSISDEPIDLYINSPGGSVIDGLSIIDTMQFVKSKVRTINTGQCASMGAWILASGDIRCALPSAETMLHQMSIAGGGLTGNIQDIEVSVKHMNKLNKKMLLQLASRTSRSVEELENVTKRDYYMNTEEAIAFGVIDEVISKAE